MSLEASHQVQKNDGLTGNDRLTGNDGITGEDRLTGKLGTVRVYLKLTVPRAGSGLNNAGSGLCLVFELRVRAF
jgi:hypothetical protein